MAFFGCIELYILHNMISNVCLRTSLYHNISLRSLYVTWCAKVNTSGLYKERVFSNHDLAKVKRSIA